jgi:hypothetical protein
MSSLQTNCGVNVFATLRFIPEITGKFQESISLEIRATKEDRQIFGSTHGIPIAF